MSVNKYTTSPRISRPGVFLKRGDDIVTTIDNAEEGQRLALAANCHDGFVELFKQWLCPACGGKGEYELHGRKPNKSGVERKPHPKHAIVTCTKCEGGKLDPRARAALRAAGMEP